MLVNSKINYFLVTGLSYSYFKLIFFEIYFSNQFILIGAKMFVLAYIFIQSLILKA